MVASSRSSSSASSRRSSRLSSTTSAHRASGRSVLLTTSTTGRPAASVLRSTKRVCGSGPSLASTRSTTPSTMDSPRSTSPPKSAWPGVSTTFTVMPCQLIAVCLARIVMPFSRSRSPESMTRSTRAARSPNAPEARSMASTRVVLPWSTCATMATLRSEEPVPRVSRELSAGAARVDAAVLTIQDSPADTLLCRGSERSLSCPWRPGGPDPRFLARPGPPPSPSPHRAVGAAPRRAAAAARVN